MTTALPDIATALRLGARLETPQRLATDMVLLGTKLRAAVLEPHWRRSAWLAAAIVIRRIDDGD